MKELRQFVMRKQKSKKKKNKKLKSFDKMTFEKREKLRSKLKQERVNTKSFRTPQSFGPASDVRIIDPKNVDIQES
jgi:hypothetical protein